MEKRESHKYDRPDQQELAGRIQQLYETEKGRERMKKRSKQKVGRLMKWVRSLFVKLFKR